MTDLFLRIDAVERATGLKRAAIYKWIKEGRFPRQVSVGGRVSAWLESEILDWQQARIAERDAKRAA